MRPAAGGARRDAPRRRPPPGHRISAARPRRPPHPRPQAPSAPDSLQLGGRDLGELCENIQKYREQVITHIRCQSGGYGGGGYGKAPASAPDGAADGVYLDSKQYMRDTLKLFASDGWSAANDSVLAGYAVYTEGAVRIAVDKDIGVTIG